MFLFHIVGTYYLHIYIFNTIGRYIIVIHLSVYITIYNNMNSYIPITVCIKYIIYTMFNTLNHKSKSTHSFWQYEIEFNKKKITFLLIISHLHIIIIMFVEYYNFDWFQSNYVLYLYVKSSGPYLCLWYGIKKVVRHQYTLLFLILHTLYNYTLNVFLVSLEIVGTFIAQKMF